MHVAAFLLSATRTPVCSDTVTHSMPHVAFNAGNNAAFMAMGQGPIRFARSMARAVKSAAGQPDPGINLQASHQIEQRVRASPPSACKNIELHFQLADLHVKRKRCCYLVPAPHLPPLTVSLVPLPWNVTSHPTYP